MNGRQRRISWVVALTAAFLMQGALAAGAHTHPTPIERAAPAVVYVEARAQVEVALVEHRPVGDPNGVHIAIIQSTWTPALASASGFVIDPTGTIVTSGAITRPDLDRASIYAVNSAFRKQYGSAAPLTGDLFTRQRVGPDTDLLEQRLQACYPPLHTNDSGGCVVTVRPTYVVYPYVTSQKTSGQLDAELLPASTPDVALVRVRGATSMPTVALGTSTAGAKALSVLGFTGIPDATKPVPSLEAHLDKVGGTALKTAGLTADETKAAVQLGGNLRTGMDGGPVLGEQGQVIGFLAPDAGSGLPPAAPGRLVDVGMIRVVVSAQGVTPRRGPVDTSFEAAMHAFKNGGFAAAVPSFKAALALFPGHAMAARNLAVAEKNIAAGTPGAASPAAAGSAGGSATRSAASFPWAVVLLGVAAVLLLAAVAMLVLRRRRRPATPSGGPAPPGTPTPRQGPPSAPSRTATGAGEHQAVPSAAAAGSGPGSRGVAVIERSWSGRGGAASPSRVGAAPSGSAPPTSVPGQRPASAVGDGARAAARASAVAEGSPQAVHPSAAPAPVPGSRRVAPLEPTPEDERAFCTWCGAPLVPHHRYCGRCGVAITGVSGDART